MVHCINALPLQTQMLLVSVFVGEKITCLWGKNVLRAAEFRNTYSFIGKNKL